MSSQEQPTDSNVTQEGVKSVRQTAVGQHGVETWSAKPTCVALLDEDLPRSDLTLVHLLHDLALHRCVQLPHQQQLVEALLQQMQKPQRGIAAAGCRSLCRH